MRIKMLPQYFNLWTLQINKHHPKAASSNLHDTSSEERESFISGPLNHARDPNKNRSVHPHVGIAMIVISAFVVIAAILVLTKLGVWFENSNLTPKVLISPCGTSPAEARARNCHFDVISFCWLPDECYDSALSDSFDAEKPLEWFLDPNKTQPISHKQAMTGEFSNLYVNWEYHLRHCTAMWKKMHRAILGRGKMAIDGYIGTLEHTKHCEKMLLWGRESDLRDINTIIVVKYPDCGIL
jgi:hypothetical protein